MKQFTKDPPTLAGFLVCESVALDVRTSRPTLIGIFDIVIAAQYPATMRGSLVAIFSGVREAFDCTFRSVDFSQNRDFGRIWDIATALVTPPTIGSGAIAYTLGPIILPVSGPGIAELRVYGNNDHLGTRLITVVAEH